LGAQLRREAPSAAAPRWDAPSYHKRNQHGHKRQERTLDHKPLLDAKNLH
jgi:hypothetical protein